MKNKVVFLTVVLAELLFLLTGIATVVNADRMNVQFLGDELSVLRAQAASEEGFAAVSDSGFDTVLVETPQINLHTKGIYGISVYYESDSEGLTTSVRSPEDNRLVGVDNIRLQHSSGSYTYDIYTKTQDVPVKAYMFMNTGDEDEYLNVRSVNVDFKKGHTLLYILTSFFLIFMPLDILMAVFLFRREALMSFLRKNGDIIIAAGVVTAVASIPLMLDYIPDADDLEFSVMRIQGIADGLGSGYFPVRIHPTWFNDFGYAVGVYYGQVLLYPFAILRLCGLPMGTVYRLYVVFLNLATFFIAYFSVKKITSNKNIAVCSAAFYTMALYRLIDIHRRSAMGETGALTFLPLIVLGLAMIYDMTDKADDSKKGWIYLALGVTGVLNSHNLTTFMLVIMCILFALINLKKTMQKNTLFDLLKAIALTVILNAFYIVPFLDYSLKLRIKLNSAEKNLASKAAYLPQVFSQAYSVSGHNGEYTPIGNLPLSIGVSALFIITALLLLLWKHGFGKYKRAVLTALALFIISVILTTGIFPYETIAREYGAVYDVLQKIQYPWRFLVFDTLFITCIFIITMVMADSCYGKRIMLLYALFIIALSAVQGKHMLDDIVNQKSGPALYSAIDTYWAAVEYIPDNTDMEELFDKELLTSGDGVMAANIERDGVNTSVDVSNMTNETGYVQLPLLCYPYYRAIDDAGNGLDVIAGDYHKLCFAVPAGYSGKVKVDFREPVSWRLAELVSLAGFIILAVCSLKTSVCIRTEN